METETYDCSLIIKIWSRKPNNYDNVGYAIQLFKKEIERMNWNKKDEADYLHFSNDKRVV